MAKTLGEVPCRVWLFGSRARGDGDGFSDTDLLVEAESTELAERAADQLRTALVGDDMLDPDCLRWQALADSPSNDWRAVHAQSLCVLSRSWPAATVCMPRLASFAAGCRCRFTSKPFPDSLLEAV